VFPSTGVCVYVCVCGVVSIDVGEGGSHTTDPNWINSDAGILRLLSLSLISPVSRPEHWENGSS
jgi:hypothetical protein